MDARSRPRLTGSRLVEVARTVAIPSIAAALAVLTVTPNRGPVIAPDEMGYLAGARALAGAGNPVDMAGMPFYPIGWSTLAAVPALVFAGDAESTYTATVVLQVALLAAIALLAMHIARSVVGLDSAMASVAAGVAITVPSAVVTTRFVWSETFLAFLVMATFALLWRLFQSASRAENRRSDVVVAVVGGAAVGWMPFAHGRLLLGAIALGLFTMGVLVARGNTSLSVGFAAGATGAVLVGRILTVVVRSRVWGDEFPSNAADARRGVSSFSQIWQTVQVAGGHAWAFLIGSLGFGAVALVLAAHAFRRAPDDDTGDGARWLIATPERCLALASVVVLAATLATEAAFFSGSVFYDGTNRQDHFLYGRYLDIFQPLVVTLGVAACLAAARRSAVRKLVVLGAVAIVSIVVTHLFVDVLGNNELAYAEPFNPFTSLNLARYGARIDRAALETLTIVVLSMIALVVAARFVAGRATSRSTSLVLAFCVLPLVAMNLIRWHDAVEATDRVDYRAAQAVARHLDDVGVTDVLFDESIWVGDRLYLQFWMPHVVGRRVTLPAEVECDGTTALVTGADTTSVADMAAGRLAVVRCDDDEVGPLTVAPVAP